MVRSYAAPERAGHVNVTSKVTLDGAFFRHDPVKGYHQNIRDMLEALSHEMEKQVKGEIAGHQGAMPRSVGWSYEHTKGYVTSARTGRRWALWAAVGAVTAGMDKKDAIRTKAAVAGRHNPIDKDGRNIGVTPGIEGRFHPYRRVKSGVYRARALISADLAKGLN
jgi:hypothetical protein